MQRTLSPSLLLAAAAFSACLTAQKPIDPAASHFAAETAFGRRATAENAHWAEFRANHPGEWMVQWRPATNTPRAIYGEGLKLQDWRENTIDEGRRHALQLLQQQNTLLGLGTSEFREVSGARIGHQWSFVFAQFFRGVPVIGGRADVRVSMAGRISMFGSSAWPIAADFSTVPTIGAEMATAAAWQALGAEPSQVSQPGKARTPRLVIWGDIEATAPTGHFLCWEVPISNVDADGNGAIGRYYVDAHTGAILQYQSDKHDCGFHSEGHDDSPAAPVNTTVTVMGWTRTGLDANNPLVNVPMPGLELNVPGVGTVTTDINGQFTVNLAAVTTITVGQLDGRHHGLIAGANAPSGTYSVTPGVPTTIQLLTSAATVNEASHTTASYWCDKVNEYCRSILGNSAELNTANACVPTVNIASTCNAYYTNNTINFYQAGGGCTNTATCTVIAHEWGHGLDDRYGGISQVQGLSEGWGDLLAMYLVDDSRVGSGFQTPNVGLRDGNNTYQFGTQTEVHAAGQSWMGFGWKLRDHLATTLASRPAAIALTNDIVVGTVAADATDQPGAVLEVFLADDDDGIIGNGTPHYADLVWACQQHGLPFPTLQAPANDECTNAIVVQNGLNGPFTNILATTSTPAWSCALGGADVWFKYYVGATGPLTVSTCGNANYDTAIQIFSGDCSNLTSLGCLDDWCGLQTSLTVTVNPGIVYIRVGGYNSLTGNFSIDVNGPQGYPAATQTFGTGCYQLSKSFYETFANSAFDLANSSMTLILAGNHYVAIPAGTFVAPSPSATQLTLGDDSETTVALPGTLAYPGGTTSSLVVCSNGFVSPASGNGTDYSPTAAEWLSSVQPRWGTWHDFNPNAAGGGKVKVETIGTVTYVTWDGVYSFNTTAANTWQLQFDRASGNVTYVWTSMVASGSVWLVGFAATAPNSDLGSRDISATLPNGFATGDDNYAPMALSSNLPQLGSTLTLTTTGWLPSSPFGFQVMSLSEENPGVDLGPIGMPGCTRYTGLESVTFIAPVAGQSAWSMAIPAANSFQGLPLRGQTWAYAPSMNQLGLIVSNGVRMTVGQ